MTSHTPEADSFGHLPHPWLEQTVRDIASGQSGRLMAVVAEPPGFVSGARRPPRLAWIRDARGIEWTTALSNIELEGATP